MIDKKVNLRKVLKKVLADFLIERTNQIAMSNAVLDQKNGQMVECRHLITYKNPKIRAIWNKPAASEIGRLFQGVGKGADGVQRIKGNETFFFISRAKVRNKK